MTSDNAPNDVKQDENTIKNLLPTISNWAIAWATIALVITTAFLAKATFNMSKATADMSKQTQRLADLSVKQFKIRAYPAFLIEFKEVTFDKGKLKEVYNVVNKGEITAQNVTFLWVHGYTKGSKKMFINKTGTYYKIDKRMTTVDFQTNIFGKSKRQIVSESKLYDNFKIENLLYSLLFIKFWVPYDSKYRYESFGFLLSHKVDKKNKILLKWQDLDITAKKNFIDNYFATSYATDDRVKKFFDDYPMESVSTKKSDS